MHSKSTKFSKIMLSVTALLLITVIALGTTLSWIEGGTTLSVRTNNKGDVKTSDVPEVGGLITLDPETEKSIDLLTFDETSKYYKTLDGDLKNVYFSPVSSKDGKNFLFPVTGSDGTTFFRNGNTNDIGTKLITFDFQVKATEKCYLAFAEKPTITLTKNGVPVTFKESAFRFCIDTGSSNFVFSTSDTARNVVTDTTGTIEEFGGLYSFDNYIDKDDTTNDKLLSITDTSKTYTITVSVWLDYCDATLAENSAIFGSDVNINLKLAVGQEKVKANFEVVTFLNDNTTRSDNVGGTVDPESDWFVIGKKIKSTAQPVPGYYFNGWYTDKACESLVDGHDSETSSLEVDVPSNLSAGEEVTYYARFVKMKDMIYFVPSSDWTTDNAWFGAYVWNDSLSINKWLELKDEDGDGVYTTEIPDDGYNEILFGRLDPSNDDIDEVDFNSNVWNKTDDMNLPSDGKVLFLKGSSSWGGTGTWFTPLTVSAISGGNGTATANNVTHAVSYSNGTTNGTVTLKAVADDGYEFAGWYTDSKFENNIGTNYMTAEQTVTVTGSITYYAKFDKIPVLTVNAVVSPAGSGCSATVNSESSVSVQTGTTLTLKAEAVRGYEFTGWHVGSATGTTIGSNFNSTSTTYEVTGNDGDIVNLYAVFEKLPAITIKTVATPAEGGTATVEGETSYLAYAGETVELVATKASSTNYVFTGWYDDPECSDSDKISSSTTVEAYAVEGTDGETIILYAKFVKAYTVKAYAYTNGSKGTSGGSVKAGTASGNPATTTIYEGNSVTFTATKVAGYDFDGWYSSTSDTSADSEDTEYTVDNVTEDLKVYARFVTDKTVYLKPNSNWTSDSARFAIYVFNNSSGTNAWVSMTAVSGQSGIYSAEIPDGTWEGIIFCRMNGSTTANNWSNKWNQTGDLSIPTNGKNLFTIPSSAWDGSTTTWSTPSF